MNRIPSIPTFFDTMRTIAHLNTSRASDNQACAENNPGKCKSSSRKREILCKFLGFPVIKSAMAFKANTHVALQNESKRAIKYSTGFH